jgi:hypothetical protein
VDVRQRRRRRDRVVGYETTEEEIDCERRISNSKRGKDRLRGYEKVES